MNRLKELEKVKSDLDKFGVFFDAVCVDEDELRYVLNRHLKQDMNDCYDYDYEGFEDELC